MTSDATPRDPKSPTPAGAGTAARAPGIEEPARLVRRLRRNSVAITAIAALGILVVNQSVWQVAGLIASALLIYANFALLVTAADAMLGGARTTPSALQTAFLAFRHVLLGVFLCAIVLVPGVGPVPVALGISVLVLAILLEAIVQVLSGPHRHS